MATCYRKSFASYNKVNIYFYNVDFRRHLLLSKCLLPFYKNNRVAFMIVGGNFTPDTRARINNVVTDLTPPPHTYQLLLKCLHI